MDCRGPGAWLWIWAHWTPSPPNVGRLHRLSRADCIASLFLLASTVWLILVSSANFFMISICTIASSMSLMKITAGRGQTCCLGAHWTVSTPWTKTLFSTTYSWSASSLPGAAYVRWLCTRAVSSTFSCAPLCRTLGRSLSIHLVRTPPPLSPPPPFCFSCFDQSQFFQSLICLFIMFCLLFKCFSRD
jgi:hypothetical protein